jgi:hypothetical protein
MAPGLALFDADTDGDLDLYAVNGGPLASSPSGPQPANRLFLNRGDGSFVDATETSGAGDTGYAMGVAVGDYDGDGAPDLYVVNYGPNVLYRNRGGGRFERVTVGVEDHDWSVAAAFLDYDDDGDLDLFVVNYLLYEVAEVQPCRAGSLRIYCSPEQFAAAPDRLYRNDGEHFTEMSGETGILADGKGMGLAVGDVDGDGDSDLYVANDRTQNHLYLDEGERFREVGAETGVGYSMTGQVEGGMAVLIADFTGSGKPSIFLTNFQKEPNRLYTSSGDGFFDDLTYPSGVGFPSQALVSFGMASLDVEGDGDLDLAVGNGHVYDNAEEFIRGSSYAMSDQLFLNDGRGSFATLQFPEAPLPSRGVVSGDLDGDGDPDLVIASCGGPLRLWRNDAGRPIRFLVLQLVGRTPNTSAYGARVVARIGGRILSREVASGGGYASHGDSRVYLGLDGAEGVDHLQIRWPDGSVEESAGFEAGQRVIWRQGEGVVSRASLGKEG